jgi:CheY-like chemotaxis protein
VAKILVADDNSNVQKTVALALADLGVEVIAVNNGEAAVRKLPDIKPDLILADIFMPVRNGYEVCEYVKKNARFAHLPVVLLVGAFDPLDEREAQRVGADGILKKPFVPPDPLISMVKMLLERTLGEQLVSVGAPKPAAAARGKSGGTVATAEQPQATSSAASPVAPPVQEAAPEEEFQVPVKRVSFGEGERPMAFGQLLDAPSEATGVAGTGTLDPVEDEQILTSSRDASLGDPIFWQTEEPQPETVEEGSEAEPDLSAELPLRVWKPDEESMTRAAESAALPPVEVPIEPAIAPVAAPSVEPAVESFELVREVDENASVQASTIVEPSALISQDSASQASLNVHTGKLEDLAANPLEWMASVPPPPSAEILEPVPEWSSPETASAAEAADVVPSSSEIASEVVEPVMLDLPTPALTASPAFESKPAEHASLPAIPELDPAPEAPSSKAAAPIADPHKTQPALEPSKPGADTLSGSTARHDWADLAGSMQSGPGAPTEKKSEPVSAAMVPHVAPPVAPAVAAPANSAAEISKPTRSSTEDTARSIPVREWADIAASLPAQPVAPAAPISKAANESAEDTAHSIPKLAMTDWAAKLDNKSGAGDAEKASTPSASSTQSLSVGNIAKELAAQAKNAMAAESIPQAAASGAPNALDPAMVEAIVQRILDKMRPQVVEIITKEFLRPIVQALVQREIQKH